ncbi:hypothetical protein [Alteribacter keqinensis]|uniref:hypothetical protein n=1 Tax=Alteribacter keqinensis TaxID=2483800 RepID=UPI00115F6BCC|nr:hypothetical protein [Alteribacter keqinensis]
MKNRNIIFFITIFIVFLLFIPSTIFMQQVKEDRSFKKAAHYDLSGENLYNIYVAGRADLYEVESRLKLKEDSLNPGTYFINPIDYLSVKDDVVWRVTVGNGEMGNERIDSHGELP